MRLRNLWLAAALAAGFAISAAGQTVEIVAPAEVPEHSLVMVQTSESGTDYAWTVLGPCGEEQVAVFGRQMVFTGPPGRYAILQAWTTATGETRQAFTFTTILPAGDDQEPPDPTPTPPPPEPIIETGPRWVVIIEETADRQNLTPGQLSIIASRSLDPYCQKNGHHLRIYDQDSKDSQGNASTVIAPYIKVIDGSPLPSVVILDAATNKTLHVGPLPDGVEAMTELLKSKGG